MRLELSLGIYKMQKEPLKLGATIDEAVKNIVDIIYRRASFDKARKFIAFEDFLFFFKFIFMIKGIKHRIFAIISKIGRAHV